jgi:uncharacterized protein (DUF488 family)
MSIIYTLGTSTRSFDEFAVLLARYGIEAIVDVRRFPTSRFDHFRREEFARLLAGRGVTYAYMGDRLGGYRRGGYRAHMASAEFAEGIEALEEGARGRTTAIVCAELLPWRCHRRFISRGLESRGWEVIHLLDERRAYRQEGESWRAAGPPREGTSGDSIEVGRGATIEKSAEMRPRRKRETGIDASRPVEASELQRGSERRDSR